MVTATVVQYLNYSLRIPASSLLQIVFSVVHGNSHSTASKDFCAHVARQDCSGRNSVRVLA